mmetsp:Transcript_32953/g.57836  ORF Transcript_32953/g.57836 Transcript_32953/m.57836 type:complete len:211 (-) Transcript_32953:3746-4378(-)
MYRRMPLIKVLLRWNCESIPERLITWESADISPRLIPQDVTVVSSSVDTTQIFAPALDSSFKVSEMKGYRSSCNPAAPKILRPTITSSRASFILPSTLTAASLAQSALNCSSLASSSRISLYAKTLMCRPLLRLNASSWSSLIKSSSDCLKNFSTFMIVPLTYSQHLSFKLLFTKMYVVSSEINENIISNPLWPAGVVITTSSLFSSCKV